MFRQNLKVLSQLGWRVVLFTSPVVRLCTGVSSKSICWQVLVTKAKRDLHHVLTLIANGCILAVASEPDLLSGLYSATVCQELEWGEVELEILTNCLFLKCSVGALTVFQVRSYLLLAPALPQSACALPLVAHAAS